MMVERKIKVLTTTTIATKLCNLTKRSQVMTKKSLSATIRGLCVRCSRARYVLIIWPSVYATDILPRLKRAKWAVGANTDANSDTGGVTNKSVVGSALKKGRTVGTDGDHNTSSDEDNRDQDREPGPTQVCLSKPLMLFKSNLNSRRAPRAATERPIGLWKSLSGKTKMSQTVPARCASLCISFIPASSFF